MTVVVPMAGDDARSDEGSGPTDFGTGTSAVLDDALELLAERRRRFVIYTLLDTPAGMIGFDELVDAVGAMEAQGSPEQVTDRHRQSIAADLHHWHLPVLVESGTVTFDDRSEIVQYEGHPPVADWARRFREAELPDGDP